MDGEAPTTAPSPPAVTAAPAPPPAAQPDSPRYLVDPETGERVLAQPVQNPKPPQG
jgi:hypothetical protein